MGNNEIIKILKLAATLLELHEANDFKVKAYASAAFNLDKVDVDLAELPEHELVKLQGVSKSIAEKIVAIRDTGAFEELTSLINDTPQGVIDMLDIKGVGPKKIRVLWKDHEIDTPQKLLQACEEDKVSQIKGFGSKTQETIKKGLLFSKSQEGKYLYADVEEYALALEKELKTIFGGVRLESTGQFRRRLDIIDKLEYLIATDDAPNTLKKLDDAAFLLPNKKASGPFTWKGQAKDFEIEVVVKAAPTKEFEKKWLLTSASERHLGLIGPDGQPLYNTILASNAATEPAIYKEAGLPFVYPEMREGLNEVSLAIQDKLPQLIEFNDMKGVLHNHSNYSDGKNTLREMAEACIEQGYEYLGITDHSVSAFYANGLDDDRVMQQQREIDELNKELAPFVIFKGIESDILNDGSLDYDEDVLKSFDFIVSSIHSNLNMDMDKATMRLVKAIENPYTTILGHMTGRLLLKREGYPINHRYIIDACADNGVIIEINANPWRLDIDWRWIPYCLEKGVMLSINPDAHEIPGLMDMYYGTLVGRKGGLSKEQCLNTKSAAEVAAIFKQRKK